MPEYFKPEKTTVDFSLCVKAQSQQSTDTPIVFTSLFGLGGGIDLTFPGKGGEVLQADLVKLKVAREIVSFVREKDR